MQEGRDGRAIDDMGWCSNLWVSGSQHGKERNGGGERGRVWMSEG